jgi:hypothetical protein
MNYVATNKHLKDATQHITVLLESAEGRERAAAAARERGEKVAALKLLGEAKRLRVKAKHLRVQHKRSLRVEQARRVDGGHGAAPSTD